MPIYEFYCSDCHAIYNFFSRRINTEKIPSCPNPRCGRPALERQVSLFSVSKGRSEDERQGLPPDLDEAGLERAMMSMASELEGMDEEDPRQSAAMMRRLFGATGMRLNENLEEAISRMEAGEDPDRIEQEMGDLLEEGEPFEVRPKRLLNDLRRKLLPPRVDETLYDL